jgi:hypothetical protein
MVSNGDKNYNRFSELYYDYINHVFVVIFSIIEDPGAFDFLDDNDDDVQPEESASNQRPSTETRTPIRLPRKFAPFGKFLEQFQKQIFDRFDVFDQR